MIGLVREVDSTLPGTYLPRGMEIVPLGYSRAVPQVGSWV